MTARKFKSYTLWIKWANLGWTKAATCLNSHWPSENPIEVLEFYVESKYPFGWAKRGKAWMILPEDKIPKETPDAE